VFESKIKNNFEIPNLIFLKIFYNITTKITKISCFTFFLLENEYKKYVLATKNIMKRQTTGITWTQI